MIGTFEESALVWTICSPSRASPSPPSLRSIR